MKVVIAEKPSVARDYAKVLGATSRKDGYLEGNGYQVTWAIGHLVRLADAEEYGFAKWKLEDLPIIPGQFKLSLTGDAGLQKQFSVIKNLFANATEIIVGTDAGREGELIFRYIYQISGCNKPFKRLWISSQTDQAIRDGFAKLKSGTDYDNLYFAARSRSEADWLVGINATRALTLSSRAKSVLSIGRVQTPVLCMICARYLEHINFKPEAYWDLYITLEKDSKKFKARHPVAFKKQEEAEAAHRQVTDTATCTRAETKKVLEQAPLLFDLTSLQQESNKKFGFPAQKTLDIAQDLYEKYKLITYPRTGSRYLSDDLYPKIPGMLDVVASKTKFTAHANLLKLSPISRRPFNNDKVTDHHALLPTETNPSGVSLPPEAEKIYDLIVTRFLAAFSPPCEKEVTGLDFLSGGLLFKASGSVILVPGWRAVEEELKEKDDDPADENQKLPKVYQGDILPVTDPAVIKKMTKAKPIHTESTLLKLMETAGKELDDDELRQAIKNCGIGTPATRASVIETLFERKYIDREKKKIIPTEKGLQVYELVKDQPIASVSMTGNWEKALNLIAEGKRNYSQFIVGIHTYTQEVVATMKQAGLAMPGAQNPKVEIHEVGKIGEDLVKAGKGQYGTFIIYQEKFYNVADKEPTEITPEIAMAAIEAKKVQDKEKAALRKQNLVAKIGKRYEIRNGQYGLYVTDGKINASLPKNITAEVAATWKAEQCKQTIAYYVEWKKNRDASKQ
ncbi:DNA topoisomerase 3 [Rhodocytophaga aerolata]|uniref:DNA topoisomerase n=1 Tax=Rhodocytophaga aerolata TaxID=455078 RepID=A0ABT8RA95_9BACT|nr:DNA topoisomerase 3 [Rhodocytophaga aerolata]MDO1449028.1 DNA topoisomerase 3 [Rhodocytophaga aerolata]